jgi:beta-lactamase superfamily II metal-dependent hydrolase
MIGGIMPQSVAKGASMSTSIQFLHASHGDCIFLRHEQEGKIFNLLIDGGPGETFGQLNGYAKPLRLLLEELKANGEVIDLAVITHVDDDHIGGVLAAMSYDDYLPSQRLNKLMIKKMKWQESRELKPRQVSPKVSLWRENLENSIGLIRQFTMN